MAIGQVRDGRGEHRECVLEALGDPLRREQAHFRGGELDRQGQAVEPAADVGDGRRVLGRQGEFRFGRLRTIDEELHRRRAARATQCRRPFALGGAQRLDLVDPLAADAQHDAARHQETRERRDGVQPHQDRGGIHDLLEVVEHDEHAPAFERPRDALFESGLAVVADAERVRDLRKEQSGLEDPLQQHEVRAVGEQILGGVGDLDRQPALADAPRTDQAHEAVLALCQQLAHLRQVMVAADRGGVRGRDAGDEGCRALVVRRARVVRSRLVEAFRQEGGEVVRDPLLQVGGGLERQVGGGVVALDAPDQLGEPLLALVAALDVDELRHVFRGEVVLVFQTGDLFPRRHPPVAVGVDADEDVALGEVGPVQLAGRMRPRTELEHDRCQAHAFDGRAHGGPFVRELAQSRAHENPDPLVGRADQGLSPPSHENIMASSGRQRTRPALRACRRPARGRRRGRTRSLRAPSSPCRVRARPRRPGRPRSAGPTRRTADTSRPTPARPHR